MDHKLRIWGLRAALLLATVLLACWTVAASDSFQACVEEQQHHTPPKTEEGARQIVMAGVQRSFRCSGEFIEANNAAITALATAIIAAFTITLWRATTEQGRLTKQALVADKRAFVYAINIFPTWEKDRFFTRNYNWRIRPEWKNSGETTTKGLRLYTDCIVRNTPLPQDSNLVEIWEAGVGFLGPGASMKGGAAPLLPQGAITPYDLVEAMYGRRFIYLWGWVRYFDVFEGTPERTTKFCWQIFPMGDPFLYDPSQPQTALNWSYLQMTYGNCANEECKDAQRPVAFAP